MKRWGLSVWASTAVLLACGGDEGSSAPATCVPGTTQACAGPDACWGTQVCAEDGLSFGTCTCSGEPGTQPPGNDGGSGGDGGATSPTTGGATTGGTGIPPGGAPAGTGAMGGASTGGSGNASGDGGALAGGAGGTGGDDTAGGTGGVTSGGSGGTPGPTTCVPTGASATCGDGVKDPGEICFLPPQVVPYDDGTDAKLEDSAIADVTGDGRPDLVALTIVNTTVRLHVVSLPSGGSFSVNAPSTFTQSDLRGVSFGVGEMTGDAYADAYVWKEYGAIAYSREVSLLAGAADGSFGSASWSSAPFPVPPPPITLGSVTGGALLDLIVSGSDVTVYPADTIGSFGSATTQSPGSMAAWRIVLADLTGDGFPEILGGYGGSVSFGLNDGTGVFSFWSQYPISGSTIRPQAADMDADGFVDIVVGTNEAKVHVLRGNGFGGVIGDSIPHPVASSSVGVAYPMDITNDGCLDIVAFHGGGVISVLPATDPGEFDTYRTYPGLRGTVFAGDFNDDGSMDFASAGLHEASFVLANP